MGLQYPAGTSTSQVQQLRIEEPMSKFALRTSLDTASIAKIEANILVVAQTLGSIAGSSYARIQNYLDVRAAKRLGIDLAPNSADLPPCVVATEFPDDGSYPYFRMYDVNHFVTEHFVTNDYIRDGALRYISTGEKTPEITSRLMLLLMAIDGVSSVVLRPYEVTMHIGKAYDWSNIEPQVMKVFSDTFGWNSGPLVVERRTRHYNRSCHSSYSSR